MTETATTHETRRATNPLYRPHRVKLGVMAFNCSHGSTITTAEDAWVLNWPDTRTIAHLADRAGLDVLLPVGRWRGYGRRWLPDLLGQLQGRAAAVDR